MREERNRILKMVEEGKMTAEEAIILLESLEKKEDVTTKEISNHVNWDGAQTNKQEEKQSTVKTKFTDFVGSAIQKIKEVDFDLNFGTPFNVNHIFQQKDVYLTRMELDIANGSVEIVPWDEPDVRIECKAKVYRVNSLDEAKQSFLKDTRFSSDGEIMRFSIQKKQMKVQTTFYIPQAAYQRINVRMFNGHITGEGLNVQDFEAKTANGKIVVSGFRSKELELETANGHIRIDNSQANQLEAETINGTIDVSGSYEKIDLQSFHGHIACDLLDERCHTIFVKSKAGNIEIKMPDTVEVDGEFKTNIGSYTCNLSNVDMIKEKKDVVQKEYHFVANKGQSHSVHLEAESRAGSIVVKPK